MTLQLNDAQVKTLMNRFPSSLKLSYEKRIHNKVSSDICLAIPMGKKVFAWFTYIHKHAVCIILEIGRGRDRKIENIYTIQTSFDENIALGTIFYGTNFMYNNRQFICIENVFRYKGKDVSRFNFVDKLSIINRIFKNEEMKQESFMKSHYIFGAPTISKSYDEIIQLINKLPYKIYAIHFRNLRIPRNTQLIFCIVCDIHHKK